MKDVWKTIFSTAVLGFSIIVISATLITSIALLLGYSPPDQQGEYMDICLATPLTEQECQLRFRELTMLQDSISSHNKRLNYDDAVIISSFLK